MQVDNTPMAVDLFQDNGLDAANVDLTIAEVTLGAGGREKPGDLTLPVGPTLLDGALGCSCELQVSAQMVG